MTKTKVAVGILDHPKGKMLDMRRWVASDLMTNPKIWQEVVAFVAGHHVRKVIETVGVLGCPHEEGVDYLSGSTCSMCPYWSSIGDGRWQTGEPKAYPWPSWMRLASKRTQPGAARR